MTGPDPLLAATQHYLESLEPTERVALLGALRLPTGRPNRAAAARVIEAVPNRAAAIALLAGLPRDDELFVLRTVLRGEHAFVDASGDPAAMAFEPLDAASLRASAHRLMERGLLRQRFHGYGDIELFPPLARHLEESAFDWAFSPLKRLDAEEPCLGFRLAMAAGLFAAEEPTLTKALEVHSAALAKLQRRLATAPPWAQRMTHEFATLRRLGILATETAGERRFATLDAAQAQAGLGASAEELALAALPVSGSGVHAQVLAHLRAVCAPLGARGATMAQLAATPLPSPRSGTHAYYAASLDHWQHSVLVLSLVSFGFAARVDPVEGAVRVRPATPAPHGTARWIVQPSLEVLVPWDVPPSRVALLGATADLVSADRVCRFRLTRESVLRGVRLLGGAPAVVTLLEEGGGAPLAQNVAVTLAGWAAQWRVLRPVRGDVVVADAPELRAVVTRATPPPREIAPGVFLLAEGELGALMRRAKQEGVHVAPLRRGDGTPDTSRHATPPPAIATRAATAAAEIRRFEEATKAKPPPRATRADRDPPPSARARADERFLARLERELGETLGVGRVGPRNADSADEAGDDDEGDDEEEDDFDEVRERRDHPSTQIFAREPGRPAPLRALPKLPPAPPISATWSTPLPGALRVQLEAAAAAGAAVELMYVNSKQVPTAFLVEPNGIRHAGGVAFLDAHDLRKGNDCSLALDRITSIRLPSTSSEG